MNFALRCIHSRATKSPEHASTAAKSVDVQTVLEGATLVVDFQVNLLHAHGNPELQKDKSQWALWDEGDVVELFLATGDIKTQGYFEFQLSPWNQFFTLHILEPRKRTDDRRPMPFEHQSAWDATSGVWKARMKIPLREYGWQGSPASLAGGLFAILGPKGAQTFWSAFLPMQEKPDYHLPEHFRPLL